MDEMHPQWTLLAGIIRCVHALVEAFVIRRAFLIPSETRPRKGLVADNIIVAQTSCQRRGLVANGYLPHDARGSKFEGTKSRGTGGVGFGVGMVA